MCLVVSLLEIKSSAEEEQKPNPYRADAKNMAE